MSLEDRISKLERDLERLRELYDAHTHTVVTRQGWLGTEMETVRPRVQSKDQRGGEQAATP